MGRRYVFPAQWCLLGPGFLHAVSRPNVNHSLRWRPLGERCRHTEAAQRPARQPRHAIRWPAGSRTRPFHRWVVLGSGSALYASQPVFLLFFVWKGRAHLERRRSRNVEIKLKAKQNKQKISNKQTTKTKQRQTNKRNNNQPRTVFCYDLQFTGIVVVQGMEMDIYISCFLLLFLWVTCMGRGGGGGSTKVKKTTTKSKVKLPTKWTKSVIITTDNQRSHYSCAAASDGRPFFSRVR